MIFHLKMEKLIIKKEVTLQGSHSYWVPGMNSYQSESNTDASVPHSAFLFLIKAQETIETLILLNSNRSIASPSTVPTSHHFFTYTVVSLTFHKINCSLLDT